MAHFGVFAFILECENQQAPIRGRTFKSSARCPQLGRAGNVAAQRPKFSGHGQEQGQGHHQGHRHDRAEQARAFRVPHRPALRGRRGVAGLGAEGAARGADQLRRRLRDRDQGRDLPGRRLDPAADQRLHPRDRRGPAHAQAAVAPQGDRHADRRGGAQGLHPGAHRDVLEERQGQGGGRPGARQAGARQARHREAARLADREAAHMRSHNRQA